MIEDVDIIYWVWLSQILGPGNQDVEYILSKCDSPKELYNFGQTHGFHNIKFLSHQMIEKANRISLDVAKDVVKNCKRNKFEIITIKNHQYPDKLRNIYSSPMVLYISGNIDNLKLENTLSIAIVGARDCSEYARDVAAMFSDRLSLSGVTIVSGMAIGVDSVALERAVENGGKVVSVLGCGLDIDYPLKNAELREKIANFDGGCVVSEYPPGTKPFASNFPVRNRIMAGLSDGVLVVEAGDRSGSLVTARIALDQGKDVYGVPNHIFFKNNLGVMNLLKEGAVIVTEPDDILNQYRWQYKLTNKRDNLNTNLQNKRHRFDVSGSIKIGDYSYDVVSKVKEVNVENYDQNCCLEGVLKDIFLLLKKEGPQNIDYISEKLNIRVNELLIKMTELELEGYVKNFPGMKYGVDQ